MMSTSNLENNASTICVFLICLSTITGICECNSGCQHDWTTKQDEVGITRNDKLGIVHQGDIYVLGPDGENLLSGQYKLCNKIVDL